MPKQYPNVEAVLNATQQLAPKNWIVTAEYPDQIGVSHPNLTDDQFISFGDVNGYFSFNDAFSDGCGGSMEDLTDYVEIATNFWLQVAKHYPDLVEQNKPLTANEIVENNKKIIAENNLKSWQEIHTHTISARLENKGE
jgi:hypothetical protein